jgi:hypothetical protein
MTTSVPAQLAETDKKLSMMNDRLDAIEKMPSDTPAQRDEKQRMLDAVRADIKAALREENAELRETLPSDSSEDEIPEEIPVTVEKKDTKENDEKDKKDKKKQKPPEGFASRSEYKSYLKAKKAAMENRPYPARKHKDAMQKAMNEVKDQMKQMKTDLTKQGEKNTKAVIDNNATNTQHLTHEGKENTKFLAEHNKALAHALGTQMQTQLEEIKQKLELVSQSSKQSTIDSGSRGSQEAMPATSAIANASSEESTTEQQTVEMSTDDLTETELKALLTQKQKEKKDAAAKKKKQDRDEATRKQKRAKLEAELAKLD